EVERRDGIQNQGEGVPLRAPRAASQRHPQVRRFGRRAREVAAPTIRTHATPAGTDTALRSLTARAVTPGDGAWGPYSSDVVSLISFVMLSFASPNSIMHFSL